MPAEECGDQVRVGEAVLAVVDDVDDMGVAIEVFANHAEVRRHDSPPVELNLASADDVGQTVQGLEVLKLSGANRNRETLGHQPSH